MSNIKKHELEDGTVDLSLGDSGSELSKEQRFAKYYDEQYVKSPYDNDEILSIKRIHELLDENTNKLKKLYKKLKHCEDIELHSFLLGDPEIDIRVGSKIDEFERLIKNHIAIQKKFKNGDLYNRGIIYTHINIDETRPHSYFKIYIGKTLQPVQRWYPLDFRYDPKRAIIANNEDEKKARYTHFYNAILCHKPENFVFLFLSDEDHEMLDNAEAYYIDKYRALNDKYGYNNAKELYDHIIDHNDFTKLHTFYRNIPKEG